MALGGDGEAEGSRQAPRPVVLRSICEHQLVCPEHSVVQGLVDQVHDTRADALRLVRRRYFRCVARSCTTEAMGYRNGDSYI